MSAVDTSALIAILRQEPDASFFASRLGNASRCLISAVSHLEASVVLAGRSHGAVAWNGLDALLRNENIEIDPHDQALATLARQAFLRFGKGRHRAALNLGDCAAYALAKARNIPLLFKGNDFAATDIIPVI